MPDRADVQVRLGQAVKRLRAERRLTQEEVARRAGIHPTYLSDIERGARNPSFLLLVRLTAGLGASIVELGHAYESYAGRRRT